MIIVLHDIIHNSRFAYTAKQELLKCTIHFSWYVPLFIGIGGLFATYTYITVMLKRKLKTWEGTYDPDVERKKVLTWCS